MNTTHDLIGIPWVARGRDRDGADCWGLCLLAARQLFGLQLPEYFYTPEQLLQHAEGLIAHETGPAGAWRRVEGPFDPGTVHVFRIRGHVTHCGLHLGGDDFIHSLEGQPSAIERLSDVQWSRRRVGSFVYA